MKKVLLTLILLALPVIAQQTIKINSSAILSWNPAAGATSYVIYRATSSGACTPTIGAGCTAIKSGVQCCTYTDNKVAAPGTYYYVVTAYNLSGNTQSSPSNQVTAVIP